MKRLEGKVAVITGAARGIGRAIAVAFASEGAIVIAMDKAAPVSPTTAYPVATAEDLEETGRQVADAGSRCCTYTLDTRDKTALQQAAEEVQKQFGKIDVLVANAGIQVFAPLNEMTDAQWQDVIDVNLTGTANTVRTFIPYMMAKKTGSIIITASGQGKKGFRHGASYAASKWGLLGFMKLAALDLGKYGIRVNALVPGLVDTDMTMNQTRLKEAYQDYRSDVPEHITPEEAAKVREERTAMQLPWVTADDMAPVAVFLASDEARRISGSSFDVDAGDSALFTA